jgi:hypothetical protein
LHKWQSKFVVSAWHNGKKTFLSTLNIKISQSVWSTFAKLFAHVLLVV